ncbi:hypothetical protein FSP39_012207 [Pinctada imbricata]|uniref:MAM domain-containing protein n=1 Tax=Pinctada imbricata TaxID=66713 RepID=A0AA88YQZ0_PINIB|nr:hypothetical protein FSP39_012207 [Pinctada imbricata]
MVVQVVVYSDAKWSCDPNDTDCRQRFRRSAPKLSSSIQVLGPTPSSGTGPSAANQGVKYGFIEASPPVASGDRALLQSSTIYATSVSHCLIFDYHMFGSSTSVGTLRVYTENVTAVQTIIFEKSGNQGDQWFTVSVDIPATTGLIVSTMNGSRQKKIIPRNA